MMDLFELNAILYYADFISLREQSIPVTDNCKYFFIHESPINSALIANCTPDVDINNKYYQQAYREYSEIKNKFGNEGVQSYIDNISNLKACGMVDAERMLRCIHQYSDKHERNKAFKKYRDWKKNQTFTHIIKDDDGNEIEQKCSKYVYHYEKSLKEQELL